MSLIKKLAGETVIYGLSSILPRILHFTVFTIYFTRKFPTQSDFGIYRDLYAYATILLVMMIFRMDTAMFRFGSRELSVPKAFGTAIVPVFTFVLIGFLLMFFNAETIAEILGYNNQGYYVKWFSFILGFDALSALPFARYRLENKAKKFMMLKLLNTGIMILIVLFYLEICPWLIEQGHTWAQAVFDPNKKLDYIFKSNLIASSIIFMMVLPDLIHVKINLDWTLLKKMIAYTAPLVVVGLAGNINTAFAAPLQKYFLGGENLTQNLTQAGIYAAPAALAIFLNLFTTAFNYAAEPFFFKQHDQSTRTLLFGNVSLLYTIFSIFVLLGIVMYVDLILLIMGKNYRSATEIVPILLFANVFLGLYYNFSIWYKLKDKTHIGAILSIIGALITLIVSIFYLPRIGYLASAWGALACFSFMAIAGYVTGQIYFPIKYPIIKICRQIIFAFILVWLAKWFASTQSDQILIYTFNTGLLILYASLTYALEKDLIREMIK